MIRRQIISMSIADEKNVFLFPDEIPINIGNPSDLKRLKDLFPNRNIYITVRSEVVERAFLPIGPPGGKLGPQFPAYRLQRSRIKWCRRRNGTIARQQGIIR